MPSLLKSLSAVPWSSTRPLNALLRRAPDRHLVDDAAGAADPLQRVRAVDQLDPIDEEAVDREAVAAAVAQRRRLGNAVDRIERRTAAQRLARARQLLAGRREGRRERRDRIGDRSRDRDLLIERPCRSRRSSAAARWAGRIVRAAVTTMSSRVAAASASGPVCASAGMAMANAVMDAAIRSERIIFPPLNSGSR
jgi:hypothetical protein